MIPYLLALGGGGLALRAYRRRKRRAYIEMRMKRYLGEQIYDLLSDKDRELVAQIVIEKRKARDV